MKNTSDVNVFTACCDDNITGTIAVMKILQYYEEYGRYNIQLTVTGTIVDIITCNVSCYKTGIEKV